MPNVKGISCYECLICRDAIEYLPIKDNCGACAKITQTSNGEKEILRRCLGSCIPKEEIVGNKVTQVDCCYDELCNVSAIPKASLTTGLLVYLITFLLK